jgi:hypothetical protein
VFVAIGWAISIHTVTAFLYVGLGGRPFWNTAILAPRFLASRLCRRACGHHHHAADHPQFDELPVSDKALATLRAS